MKQDPHIVMFMHPREAGDMFDLCHGTGKIWDVNHREDAPCPGCKGCRTEEKP